jgi:hypothetical protein
MILEGEGQSFAFVIASGGVSGSPPEGGICGSGGTHNDHASRSATVDNRPPTIHLTLNTYDLPCPGDPRDRLLT